MANEAAARSGMALSRVNIREAFVHEQFGDQFVSNLLRLHQTPLEQADALTAANENHTALAYGYGYGAQDDDRDKPFLFDPGSGVAVVAIHGTLLNRFPYSWGFVTGYQSIRKQINWIKADLLANPGDVKLVVFDTDSGGGEAAGCFELAAEIAALSELVPTMAIIDSLCCSAAYALAVACTRVYAIPSATVGSIGVYRLHIDLSGAYSEAGIKFTFVKSGEHKTDGNPYEPLDPKVEADWQEKVDIQRQLFAEHVSEHTELTVEQVLATEAQVYRAPDALDINLISGVLTPSEAVSAYLAELADDEVDEVGDDEMKTQGQEVASGAAPAQASAPVIDQAALGAAVASALAQQRTADRARASTVRQSDAAKANVALANHLLDNTEMDAASIIEACEAAGPAASANADKPKGEGEGKPAGEQQNTVDNKNHLAEAMGGAKEVAVPTGKEGGEQQERQQGGEALGDANPLLASYGKLHPSRVKAA